MAYIFYPDLSPLPDLPLMPLSETFHQQRDVSCERDGVLIPNTTTTRYPINPGIVEWAKQNISQEFHAIGLNCQGTPTGGVAIPHTDRTRNWTLMWIVDPGGANVDTIYWQEQGFGIEREPGYYPTNYQNLVKLESYTFVPNRWMLLNAKVIHSIENLQSIRKSVQLSFWDDTDFVRKWGE
jgi:hypothetical protein